MLLTILSALSGDAQSNEKESTKATITGRITLKGRGVADCSVITWSGPYSEVSQGAVPTKTDADGYFRFSVEPGNHYVWVNAPNFYVVAEGKPSLKPIRITLSARDELDDVNFRLERGGVITGKVTNADNGAVIDVAVSLVQSPEPEQTFGTTSPLWTSSMTDDRGIYRLYGVPPGQYRVAVGDRTSANNAMRGRPAVPRTYFPDTIDENKAKPVTVSSGEEITGINIKMAAAEPVFVVRGTVIDRATGAPVQNVRVGLAIYEGQKRVGNRGGNPTNQKGEFEIDRVPSGRYQLFVPSSFERSENYGESEQFEVTDEDVSGIVVSTARTASISGVIVIEGKSNPQLVQLIKSTGFFALTMPREPGHVIPHSFTIRDDGTFEVGGLIPGKLNISFSMRSGENYPALRVLRLEHEGRRDGVELNAGDRLSGVRVVIVEATSGLRGQVKLVDGSTPAKFSGSAGLYLDQQTIGWTQLDPRGNFLFENLPAGSFRLVINVNVPGNQPALSEQNVVLNPGQVGEANVLIDLKPNPSLKDP